MEWTGSLREALKKASEELAEAGVEDAPAEAEYLLTGLLGVKRFELYTDPGRRLTPDEASRFVQFVRRRARREPSQYITGGVEFLGRPIAVTPDTLIPRPETELLALEAIKEARGTAGAPVIVDLCTGSGCVAVAVALEVPGARVYATDISGPALDVARSNAKKNGVADRVEFLRGDLFASLGGRHLEGAVDVVVSNPPYVSEAEYRDLQAEVRDFEPKGALVAGPEGMDFLAEILRGSPRFLTPGGAVLVEFGYSQGERVRQAAKGAGLTVEEVIKDLSGIERILKARKRG